MLKKILVLLISCFIFIACTSSNYTMNISQSELEENINKKFPIKKSIMFGTLYLKDPKIKLNDTQNRVIIGFDFEYKMPFMSAHDAYMEASGVIIYNKDKSAFYLHEPKLEDIKFLDKSLKKIVPDSMKTMMNGFIGEFFIKHEIYKIKDDSIKSIIYKKTMKSIVVKDGQLQLTLGL